MTNKSVFNKLNFRFILTLLVTGIVLVCLTLLIIGRIEPKFILSAGVKIISSPENLPPKRAEVLYVLGGAGADYKKLINRAADLYQTGLTDRIILFKSEVDWGYDSTLRRNITKNEGEIMRLTGHGVPPDHIDLIPVNEGFFGTLSEARDLSDYLAQKKVKSVILVASYWHTRRVFVSFGHYLHQKNIDMYIAHAQGEFGTQAMVTEIIKLWAYQVIIRVMSSSS